ncbi:MAG: hypothetical protein RLZZ555_1411, partial [Pseudomonadota bacterium]
AFLALQLAKLALVAGTMYAGTYAIMSL